VRKRLTDRFLRSVTTTGTQADYWDETLTGFGLRVSAKGKKTFQIYYRHNRLQRRMVLGPYPVLSLAQARKHAKDLLADATKGSDPASIRSANRNAETFAQLAAAYIKKLVSRKKRSSGESERIVRRELLPAWKSRKAKDITRRDIQDLTQGIAERAPYMANRSLSVVRQIFKYGVEGSWLELSPCQGIPRPGDEKRRQRFLDIDELTSVSQTLQKDPTSTGTILMLQLLTAQRVGEVRQMQVADLDLARGWWTIPSEFSKNEKSHHVPLSAAALSILTPRVEAAKGRWVFPSHTDKSRPVGYPTIHYAVRRISKAAGVTGWRSHDLRRTVGTHLTGGGLTRFVLSRILNHTDAVVTGVYDMYEYDNEKKAALDAWGRRMTAIIEGTEQTGKVVPFVSGKK